MSNIHQLGNKRLAGSLFTRLDHQHELRGVLRYLADTINTLRDAHDGTYFNATLTGADIAKVSSSSVDGDDVWRRTEISLSILDNHYDFVNNLAYNKLCCETDGPSVPLPGSPQEELAKVTFHKFADINAMEGYFGNHRVALAAVTPTGALTAVLMDVLIIPEYTKLLTTFVSHLESLKMVPVAVFKSQRRVSIALAFRKPDTVSIRDFNDLEIDPVVVFEMNVENITKHFTSVAMNQSWMISHD